MPDALLQVSPDGAPLRLVSGRDLNKPDLGALHEGVAEHRAQVQLKAGVAASQGQPFPPAGHRLVQVPGIGHVLPLPSPLEEVISLGQEVLGLVQKVIVLTGVIPYVGHENSLSRIRWVSGSRRILYETASDRVLPRLRLLAVWPTRTDLSSVWAPRS